MPGRADVGSVGADAELVAFGVLEGGPVGTELFFGGAGEGGAEGDQAVGFGLDTTGSGEAAAAAFIYSMMHGASMEDCLDASFLLATFASTSIGARSAFVE